MADSSSPAAQAWRKRILNQRSSGKSIRAWCRTNNCQEHAFYWWRTRLGLSLTSGAVQAKPIVFAEAVVEDKPVAIATGPMTLRFKSGHELILPAAMPIEQVAKLIRTIEGAA
jgi:hypothetical protein